MLQWSYIGLVVLSVCLGIVHASPSKHESKEDDERTIRSMVEQAILRLNRGDVTAFNDFGDEGADYVGVDGRMTKGRTEIQELFRQMAKGAGQETGTVEQIRFITPELAMVDGSWTVTGARDASGKELPLIKGRDLNSSRRRMEDGGSSQPEKW